MAQAIRDKKRLAIIESAAEPPAREYDMDYGRRLRHDWGGYNAPSVLG